MLIVRQGLAHAHHHHIGHHTVGGVALSPECVLDKPKLTDDFSGGQVATKALMPRGTKAAANRATRLRRNAQRAAIRLGNVHGLDRIARSNIKQPLDRAV